MTSVVPVLYGRCAEHVILYTTCWQSLRWILSLVCMYVYFFITNLRPTRPRTNIYINPPKLLLDLARLRGSLFHPSERRSPAHLTIGTHFSSADANMVGHLWHRMRSSSRFNQKLQKRRVRRAQITECDRMYWIALDLSRLAWRETINCDMLYLRVFLNQRPVFSSY